MSDERGAGGERLLDHEYDGIRECDNPSPFWLTSTYAVCTVFAAVYLIWFHFGGPGESETARFEAAWTAHQAERVRHEAAEAAQVSEDVLRAGAGDRDRLQRGREVFAKNCVACHTDNGRGLVGPNLTDSFQIHGSTRLDLYTVVRDGIPAKGMIAWGPVLPAEDVVAVTAFVATLRGTNVPDGKPPEGAAVGDFP